MIHGSVTMAAGTRDGGFVVAANVNSDDRDSIEMFTDLLREASDTNAPFSASQSTRVTRS
jgi:hypothetical protein